MSANPDSLRQEARRQQTGRIQQARRGDQSVIRDRDLEPRQRRRLRAEQIESEIGGEVEPSDLEARADRFQLRDRFFRERALSQLQPDTDIQLGMGDITRQQGGRFGLTQQARTQEAIQDLQPQTETEIGPQDIQQTQSGFGLTPQAQRQEALANLQPQTDIQLQPNDLTQTGEGFGLSRQAQKQEAAQDTQRFGPSDFVFQNGNLQVSQQAKQRERQEQRQSAAQQIEQQLQSQGINRDITTADITRTNQVFQLAPSVQSNIQKQAQQNARQQAVDNLLSQVPSVFTRSDVTFQGDQVKIEQSAIEREQQKARQEALEQAAKELKRFSASDLEFATLKQGGTNQPTREVGERIVPTSEAIDREQREQAAEQFGGLIDTSEIERTQNNQFQLTTEGQIEKLAETEVTPSGNLPSDIEQAVLDLNQSNELTGKQTVTLGQNLRREQIEQTVESTIGRNIDVESNVSTNFRQAVADLSLNNTITGQETIQVARQNLQAPESQTEQTVETFAQTEVDPQANLPSNVRDAAAQLGVQGELSGQELNTFAENLRDQQITQQVEQLSGETVDVGLQTDVPNTVRQAAAQFGTQGQLSSEGLSELAQNVQDRQVAQQVEQLAGGEVTVPEGQDLPSDPVAAGQQLATQFSSQQAAQFTESLTQQAASDAQGFTQADVQLRDGQLQFDPQAQQREQTESVLASTVVDGPVDVLSESEQERLAQESPVSPEQLFFGESGQPQITDPGRRALAAENFSDQFFGATFGPGDVELTDTGARLEQGPFRQALASGATPVSQVDPQTGQETTGISVPSGGGVPITPQGDDVTGGNQGTTGGSGSNVSVGGGGSDGGSGDGQTRQPEGVGNNPFTVEEFNQQFSGFELQNGRVVSPPEPQSPDLDISDTAQQPLLNVGGVNISPAAPGIADVDRAEAAEIFDPQINQQLQGQAAREAGPFGNPLITPAEAVSTPDVDLSGEDIQLGEGGVPTLSTAGRIQVAAANVALQEQGLPNQGEPTGLSAVGLAPQQDQTGLSAIGLAPQEPMTEPTGQPVLPQGGSVVGDRTATVAGSQSGIGQAPATFEGAAGQIVGTQSTESQEFGAGAQVADLFLQGESVPDATELDEQARTAVDAVVDFTFGGEFGEQTSIQGEDTIDTPGPQLDLQAVGTAAQRGIETATFQQNRTAVTGPVLQPGASDQPNQDIVASVTQGTGLFPEGTRELRGPEQLSTPSQEFVTGATNTQIRQEIASQNVGIDASDVDVTRSGNQVRFGVDADTQDVRERVAAANPGVTADDVRIREGPAGQTEFVTRTNQAESGGLFGGFFQETEASLREDIRTRRDALDFSDEVSDLTPDGPVGRTLAGVAAVPGEAASAVPTGLLAADTAVEGASNLGDTAGEFGVGRTAETIGLAAGEVVESQSQRIEERPFRFGGELAGEVALGFAASRAIREGPERVRNVRARFEGRPVVDFETLTSEATAEGRAPFPLFETPTDAPVGRAVSEVQRRAAEQPDVLQNFGDRFGVPEAVGFRAGQRVRDLTPERIEVGASRIAGISRPQIDATAAELAGRATGQVTGRVPSPDISDRIDTPDVDIDRPQPVSQVREGIQTRRADVSEQIRQRVDERVSQLPESGNVGPLNIESFELPETGDGTTQIRAATLGERGQATPLVSLRDARPFAGSPSVDLDQVEFSDVGRSLDRPSSFLPVTRLERGTAQLSLDTAQRTRLRGATELSRVATGAEAPDRELSATDIVDRVDELPTSATDDVVAALQDIDATIKGSAASIEQADRFREPGDLDIRVENPAQAEQRLEQALSGTGVEVGEAFDLVTREQDVFENDLLALGQPEQRRITTEEGIPVTTLEGELVRKVRGGAANLRAPREQGEVGVFGQVDVGAQPNIDEGTRLKDLPDTQALARSLLNERRADTSPFDIRGQVQRVRERQTLQRFESAFAEDIDAAPSGVEMPQLQPSAFGQALNTAEAVGFTAGATTASGLITIEEARPQPLAGPLNRVGGVANQAGQRVGEFIAETEQRRPGDTGGLTDSILFRSESEPIGGEFEVQRGQFELPGLFTSPDLSPLRLDLGGVRSRLSNFRLGIPFARGEDAQITAFPGDRIAGMPPRAAGSGVSAPTPAERGTPGDIFLTQEADTGTAFVRATGDRGRELETTFPPETRFAEFGEFRVNLPRGGSARARAFERVDVFGSERPTRQQDDVTDTRLTQQPTVDESQTASGSFGAVTQDDVERSVSTTDAPDQLPPAFRIDVDTREQRATGRPFGQADARQSTTTRDTDPLDPDAIGDEIRAFERSVIGTDQRQRRTQTDTPTRQPETDPRGREPVAPSELPETRVRRRVDESEPVTPLSAPTAPFGTTQTPSRPDTAGTVSSGGLEDRQRVDSGDTTPSGIFGSSGAFGGGVVTGTTGQPTQRRDSTTRQPSGVEGSFGIDPTATPDTQQTVPDATTIPDSRRQTTTGGDSGLGVFSGTPGVTPTGQQSPPTSGGITPSQTPAGTTPPDTQPLDSRSIPGSFGGRGVSGRGVGSGTSGFGVSDTSVFDFGSTPFSGSSGGSVGGTTQATRSVFGFGGGGGDSEPQQRVPESGGDDADTDNPFTTLQPETTRFRNPTASGAQFVLGFDAGDSFGETTAENVLPGAPGTPAETILDPTTNTRDPFGFMQ